MTQVIEIMVYLSSIQGEYTSADGLATQEARA